MKVFISWSGDKSQAVAQAINDFLPIVIQSVDPFLSLKDIEKGSLWATTIQNNLEASEFGVICITKDNIGSSWLNFEAGAISKKFEDARICTLLYDMTHKDIPSTSPFFLYQHTLADLKDDVYALVSMINEKSSNALKEDNLKRSFEKFWPDFAESISKIEKNANTKPLQEANLSEKVDLLIASQNAYMRELGNKIDRLSLILANNGSIKTTIGDLLKSSITNEDAIKLLVNKRIMDTDKEIIRYYKQNFDIDSNEPITNKNNIIYSFRLIKKDKRLTKLAFNKNIEKFIEAISKYVEKIQRIEFDKIQIISVQDNEDNIFNAAEKYDIQLIS